MTSSSKGGAPHWAGTVRTHAPPRPPRAPVRTGMEKRVTSRFRISFGGNTLSNLLYILRTFPELSETFVLREIQALRAAGVPVSVLAIAPGRDAAMVRESESGGQGLPTVHYLSR